MRRAASDDFRSRYRVALQPEKPSRWRLWLTGIAGVIDAATSADSGVPLAGLGSGTSRHWRVVVVRAGSRKPVCRYGWAPYERALEEQKIVLDWLAHASDEQQFVDRLDGPPPQQSSAR